MKILFLINKREYDTALSREKYNILKEFAKYHQVLITGEGYEGFIDPLSSCLEFKPTHILVRYPQTILGFDKLPSNIPKILWQNELYAIEYFKDLILKNKINYIFHAYEIRKGSKEEKLTRLIEIETSNIKWLHMPHYFNKIAPKLEKEYDILFLGNMATNIYIHRNRLKNILMKHQDIFKIKIRQHPSYSVQNSETQYKEYLEEISKARIVVGCTSVFNYFLEKLVEIPMAHSIYAGDLPYTTDEEAKANMIELNFFWDENKIIETVKHWLDNPQALEDKTTKANNYFKNTYNIYNGIKKLEHNLDEVTKDFYQRILIEKLNSNV